MSNCSIPYRTADLFVLLTPKQFAEVLIRMIMFFLIIIIYYVCILFEIKPASTRSRDAPIVISIAPIK